MPLLRSLVVCSVLGLFPHAASACGIIVRPVDTVPSFGAGQRFSTRAEDCETVLFTFEGRALTKEATVGSGPGALDVYEVVLSPEELRSLTGPGVVTLRWGVSAFGASPGDHAWIHQVSEIDLDRDGWTRSDGDVALCDSSPMRNPGAEEICDNGVDDDCDGGVDECPFMAADADAVVEGTEMNSASGSTLAVADVNGDGIADLVNAAPGVDRAGGRVYVSFGPLNGTTMTGDDATIMPVPGQTLAAGDADGDGIGDVLVGGYDANSASLLLGPITGDRFASTAVLELTTTDDDPIDGDKLATSLLIAPDIDGDGGNDIVITAPVADGADGHVYVVSAALTGSVTARNVATYTFHGSGSYLGVSTADLGDTDGDGTHDLAMSGVDSAYVVQGGMAGGSYDVSDVATAIIELVGATWSGFLDPRTLSSVDHDHDGYTDLLVGDPYGANGEDRGIVHLLSGPLAGRIDADTEAIARWEGDHIGESIATGDCNGDGEPDYLLAGWDEPYLALGPASGVVVVDTLASFPFVASQEYAAALFAPDWSGDGIEEIVVGNGSARTATGGRFAGATYVYYSDQF